MEKRLNWLGNACGFRRVFSGVERRRNPTTQTDLPRVSSASWLAFQPEQQQHTAWYVAHHGKIKGLLSPGTFSD